MTSFRQYQTEADNAIYHELNILNNSKGIVIMFCGTGKSLLMRDCRTTQNLNLLVYVFPSLSLIKQFHEDYLDNNEHILKISSEQSSTTDPLIIQSFLLKKNNKIICVTYQSFKTLLDNLGTNIIDLCIFDEAHHAVGETYQTLIFENKVCEKQLFFTATPKNTNGIVMYDPASPDKNMCGNLIYKYSYTTGLREGYLNPFEIRVDMYLDNTNYSVYECIARSILVSGNNRVLTFHTDVNTERDTSVRNFVNEKEFIKAFKNVLKNEFPKLTKKYKTVKMVGLYSSISLTSRADILHSFDCTPDNEIMVIASCETIGEGIDTKNANLCAFVDPKSSIVKIIQNIGRIVRKLEDVDKPPSTILIPCWVDKTKYLECDGDREKCDEVIRQDLGKQGNFNGILNVLSALKQEDEDLYNICLYYPTTFSPQEIEWNLENYGYTMDEPIGDGTIMETAEHLLEEDTEDTKDTDSTDFGLDYEDYEDCENDEEMLMRIAENNNVCIEVHTNSLETPVETYNKENNTNNEIIRMYKNTEDEDNVYYQPITNKTINKKRDNLNNLKPPNRNRRLNNGIQVHANKDIKVLWKIAGDTDLTKDICSCIIDCEVVDMWDEKFNDLKTFMDENKKRPSKKNKEEKKLGQWLGHQQQNYKNKKMVEKRYNIWTQFLEEYKEYLLDSDEKWDNNFNQLKTFINKNKRNPSRTLKNEEEKFLGSWLQTQQTKYKNKNMVEERYNIWTEFLEEYKKYLLNWNNNFETLKTFIDENKKRPSVHSKNQEEKTLSVWLSTQQQNYKNKTKSMKLEERYNTWTEFLEEYKEYLLTDDENWNNNFSQLKTFINENKQRPLLKNKEEKTLSVWLSTQQQNYKNKKDGMKLEERYNIWTKFLEEYKKYFITDDEIWNNNLNDLKMFIDENKKRPSQSSKNQKEKILAKWLGRQQLNYKNKKMVEERYNNWTKLLEEHNEYFIDLDETWNNNLNNLKTFINENKKRPSDYSKNEEEKQLCKWLQTQQQNYKIKKDGMKLEERYNIWTQFLEEYKEYLPNFDEKWNNNFETLKTFINEINKRPSSISKNKEEKKLGQWLGLQQLNYKNKKMVEERHNVWTQFLEEYKEYFEETPVKKSMKLTNPKAKIIQEKVIQEKAIYKEKKKAEISVLHQKYKTLTSANLHHQFQTEPQLWHEYHTIVDANEKSFLKEDIPRNRIIEELNKIKTKRTKQVVDMGCGRGDISKYFDGDVRFEFINYDHISSNKNIISCDISKMPLEDHSIEICILSLAMWGSNCKEYLTEAHRVLESGGKLYIIEPTKRWSLKDEHGNMMEGNAGSILKEAIEERGFQVINESINKFSLFECVKK